MEQYLKIASVCILGAILSVSIRRSRPEFAFCVGAVTIGFAVYAAFSLLSPVLTLTQELARTAKLSDAVITPVFKTVAIGILSQLAANVCTDAGETALAKISELCGTVVALYCAMPLAQAVLALVRTLLGG